jgi:hypothetical protein
MVQPIIDLHSDMTPEERIEAIANVSMKDKQHLKRWLQASGRTWMVFNSLELVDSLRWPDGIDILMQLIARYRDHRASLETGRYETQRHPTTGEEIQVPISKGEVLEPEELDRAIRALVTQMKERDPTWTLEKTP